MIQTGRVPLLELIRIQMDRDEFSELGSLDRWEKAYLASLIEPIDENRPTLNEWNGIIKCTLNAPPAATKHQAKTCLVSGLRGA